MASASALVLAFACLGATGVSLLGCDLQEPKGALNYSADAKRAYDAAMVEFDDKNWLEAQALLREVKRKYSYSRFAKLAELRLADIDFEQDKFAEAVRQYRQFVHDHRSDQSEVVYARSRIAEAEYRQINESLLLPSADERDQGVVMEAYREVKGFVADYPEAKESEKIRALLSDVTARLVRHELYVARFYLNRGNFEAAVGRILYALRNFGGAEGDETDVADPEQAPRERGPEGRGGRPRGEREVEARGGTSRSVPSRSGGAQNEPKEPKVTKLKRVEGHHVSGLEPEALLLLGETYLKMRKSTEAREAFEAIVRDYPESPLLIQAKNYLAFIGGASTPKPANADGNRGG
jgi:outer membrane protein assembly factor BamD